ncbi:hypothetical protein RND71_021691 [Anisodus tanguticus]|uniref:DUF2921 domain-containing protein n=1 Tax=Anisodus tanguticus TaxID=243964 RepID=A0AAE1RYL9_9SOLA|nr:hypothetical protein RND71_021691 [Anisodus tanguticus]
MGMDFDRQPDDVLGICGILSMAITRNRTLSDIPQRLSPWFLTSPGYSDLTIIFEGLYVEEAKGGDRLMCLLGTSMSPFSDSSVDLYELSLKYSCKKRFEHFFKKDDRIMLVLRYTQIFSLTSRTILGEMRSLNKKSDPKYFDKVRISSQLNYDSKYHELPDNNRIRVHKASQSFVRTSLAILKEHNCQEESKVPSFLASANQEILLNVSAQLTLTEKYFSHVAKIFLEGVYDASRGVMHTVGCREIRS